MHATSSPTLAQPKLGANLALGLAAILAAAIGVGAIVALNGRSVAAPTAGSQTSIEEALAAKHAAEDTFVLLPSSANGIESGVAAKNGLPSVLLSNDQIRAMVERPPYPTVSQVLTTQSAYDAFRQANGWDRPIVAIPSVVLSNEQIRAMVERPPFPTVPQDPATNLSDYFGGRSGGKVGEGYTDPVGTSHR